MVLVAGTTVALAYAWWATDREPFTTGATVAVVGAGLGAMAIGHAMRRRVAVRPRFSGAIGWLVLLAVLALWQLLAYVQEPRSEHPTLSSLTNDALDTHAGRTVAFVAWLGAAFALARR